MQHKMVADFYHYSMKLFTFGPGILWYGADGRVSRMFSGSKYSVHSFTAQVPPSLVMVTQPSRDPGHFCDAAADKTST